eukprot:CAMPEP_0118935988 /NCGR_PEP_ID=MMETSP1169-20130426/15941_1 /TAXON_ID=36882 /ORGANISM="Pyramimonas obovata, Strain CCMP722" /LENGTH=291 /DNA_ID=CAMNT_0006879073 /DNA_START=542 /DNA_END=1418 /DNA_ORIENTATION=+
MASPGEADPKGEEGVRAQLCTEAAYARALVNLGLPVPKLQTYKPFLKKLRTQMAAKEKAMLKKSGSQRHEDLSSLLRDYKPPVPTGSKGMENSGTSMSGDATQDTGAQLGGTDDPKRQRSIDCGVPLGDVSNSPQQSGGEPADDTQRSPARGDSTVVSSSAGATARDASRKKDRKIKELEHEKRTLNRDRKHEQRVVLDAMASLKAKMKAQLAEKEKQVEFERQCRDSAEEEKKRSCEEAAVLQEQIACNKRQLESHAVQLRNGKRRENYAKEGLADAREKLKEASAELEA